MGEVPVGKLRRAIPPNGVLYDPDRIQVFRQLGIQIIDVASSLYKIVDELNEGEGSSNVLDDGMKYGSS